MTREEIKLRQMTNQHLVTPCGYRRVAHDLCGIQAQVVACAMHALKIRSRDFDQSDPADLVRSWTLRGTVHIFLEEDLPLFLHNDRRHYLRLCDTLAADERVTALRKDYFARLITDSVANGIDTREGLKAVCTAHGMTETEEESIFNSWGGTVRALCERGTIACKVQQKKAYRLCPKFEPMDKDAAQLEMARRYFTHFAPATVNDAAYFFAAPKGEVKKWLAQLPVESVQCGGRTYYYIPDRQQYPGEIPACLFLAGFDQLMLGYQKTESLYLPPEHLRGIFNMTGIIHPAVLLRGRVVGRWQRKGAKLNITLFEAVRGADRELMESCAFRLWPDLRSVAMDC